MDGDAPLEGSIPIYREHFNYLIPDVSLRDR